MADQEKADRGMAVLRRLFGEEVSEPERESASLYEKLEYLILPMYYSRPRAWAEVMKPRSRAFIQSGNVGIPYMPKGSWIIDETVQAIHEAACEIAREDARFAHLRATLDDAERMARYDGLRRKLERAIQSEDFERAAEIRDQIRDLEPA